MTVQRFPEDFDYDDITIGQTLLNACRRRDDHSEEEGLSSCLSSSSMSHDRRGNSLFAVTQVTRKVTKYRYKILKTNRSGLSWTDKGSKSSLTVKRRLENTNSRSDYDRRSIQKLNETIESQQEELHRAQAQERRRQNHQLLHEQLLKRNWDLREACQKSLNEMEELQRFQGSTFDTIARRKLVEDRDTILELTGKTGITELNQLYE